MKHNDKLYIVTRGDISPAQRAVQSCHALATFCTEHHSVFAEWRSISDTLVLLEVGSESELENLLLRVSESKANVSSFREPDMGSELLLLRLIAGPDNSYEIFHWPCNFNERAQVFII